MSRVEENSHLKFKPSISMRDQFIESAKVSFLEDISRSLAVIADNIKEDETIADIKEADIYVRDHLLIEWLVDHLLLPSTNIEALHDAWIDYINKEGEKHG